jgi:fatty-acyl-CoA synthase
VTLRPGALVSDEDLVGHVRNLLAGYKVPRDIVGVDELPHTAIGKILKFELCRQA